MFDADFLANAIVWRWILNFASNVITGVIFTLVIVGGLAYQGMYVPLVIVCVLAFLVFLGVRRIIRRQAEAQKERDAYLTDPRWKDPDYYSNLRMGFNTDNPTPQNDPSRRGLTSRY